MTQVALPLKSPAVVTVSNSASKGSDQVLTAGNLAPWEQTHAVESSVSSRERLAAIISKALVRLSLRELKEPMLRPTWMLLWPFSQLRIEL